MDSIYFSVGSSLCDATSIQLPTNDTQMEIKLA